MSPGSDITVNDSEKVVSFLHPNDTAGEEATQKRKISRFFSKLKSVFQQPQIQNSKANDTNVCPSRESWPKKFSLIPGRFVTNKFLVFLLSYCFPISGSNGNGCSSHQNEPILVCLPCQPCYTKPKKEEKKKPVGMITRNKEMELSGGKIIYGCECGRRNGLSGGASCPRSCCMNNPGCFMSPPQCWPQFKEPPKPPPIPERKMICIPLELVYYDPSQMG